MHPLPQRPGCGNCGPARPPGKLGCSPAGRCGHPQALRLSGACRLWISCRPRQQRPARAVLRGVLAGSRQSPGRTGFDEPGHEVALPALTGPDAAHLAHIQRQTTGAVGLALAAEGVVHIAQHIGQRELRVALQECGHLSLVLFRREGAGGVDQFAARREAAAALSRMSAPSSAHCFTNASQCWASAAGSLRNIPSPEQGASTRTRSKNSGRAAAMRAGVSLSTTALDTPIRSRLLFRISARAATYSLLTSRPCPCRAAASWLPCRRGQHTDPAPASRA